MYFFAQLELLISSSYPALFRLDCELHQERCWPATVSTITHCSHALDSQVTLAELKFNSSSTTATNDVVGQLQKRSITMMYNQPGRTKAILAAIFRDHFFLVTFYRGGKVEHTTEYSLLGSASGDGMKRLLTFLAAPPAGCGWVDEERPKITLEQGDLELGFPLKLGKPHSVSGSAPQADSPGAPSVRGTRVWKCRFIRANRPPFDAILKIATKADVLHEVPLSSRLIPLPYLAWPLQKQSVKWLNPCQHWEPLLPSTWFQRDWGALKCRSRRCGQCTMTGIV